MRLATLRTALLAGLLAAAPAAAEREPPGEALRELVRAAVAESASFEDRFDAEVWLTDMAGRLDDRAFLSAAERLELLRLAHHEATRTGLRPELVLAVIEVESNFDRFAISEAGALGLMQVMPFWLEELDRPRANLMRMETNLRIGTTILRYYLDMEQGNLRRALARYNGSLGEHWYPDRVFRALNRRWAP
ncbi:MAG: lytic transglycosylase domain-containing protein [Gammaproteobacteria bacterium]|nr:lytic transglycosylase domain-containing protein [Gammaproteobacteria bacterium]